MILLFNVVDEFKQLTHFAKTKCDNKVSEIIL